MLQKLTITNMTTGSNFEVITNKYNSFCTKEVLPKRRRKSNTISSNKNFWLN
jgi:hypothetical protein